MSTKRVPSSALDLHFWGHLSETARPLRKLAPLAPGCPPQPPPVERRFWWGEVAQGFLRAGAVAV